MSKPILGIIGGGQLGSMLAIAANKLEIKTAIFCDDIDAPAQKFSKLLMGCCPLPSYPSVVVLSIPGSKSSTDSMSDFFSIDTYRVVLIFKLLIKSFSANLC